MILIVFAALMLFGGEKLPELARGLGKGIRDFKDASEDVKREINNQINNYEEKKPEVKASTEEETVKSYEPVAGTLPAFEATSATDAIGTGHTEVSHLASEAIAEDVTYEHNAEVKLTEHAGPVHAATETKEAIAEDATYEHNADLKQPEDAMRHDAVVEVTHSEPAKKF